MIVRYYKKSGIVGYIYYSCPGSYVEYTDESLIRIEKAAITGTFRTFNRYLLGWGGEIVGSIPAIPRCYNTCVFNI